MNRLLNTLKAAFVLFFLSVSAAYGATIYQTNSSDTLTTLRTNVNSSLVNINAQLLSTTTNGVLNQLAIWTGTGSLGTIATSSLGLKTTDVAEGTNLYFTNARVLSYLDSLSKGYFFSTTSTDYWKTQNNFFSTTSAAYWLTTKSTSDLAEGSNLYWTQTRFDNALSGTTSVKSITTLPSLSLPYSQITGAPTSLGYPFQGTGNSTSTLTQFNGGITAYASSTVGDGTQAGGLTINGGATTTGSLYLPSLGAPAGTFLAADPTGRIIATSTPSGGGSSFGQSFAIDASKWLSPTTTTYGINSSASGLTYGFGIGDSLFAYASSTNRMTVLGLNAGGTVATTSSADTGDTVIGAFAGASQVIGADENTLIGSRAGFNITSGANNVIIGSANTGSNENLTTGSKNIKIGYNISFPSATASNQLNIGNAIFGTGLSGTGSTVAGNIGISTTSPAATFSVGGNVFIGSATAGGTTGRLGINTSSPGAKLDIRNDSGTTVNWGSTNGTTYGYLDWSSSSAVVGGVSTKGLILAGGGLATQGISIDTSGNATALQNFTVTGTLTPNSTITLGSSAQLSVSSHANTAPWLAMNNGGPSYYMLMGASGSSGYNSIDFGYGGGGGTAWGTRVMSIVSDSGTLPAGGAVGVGTTSPWGKLSVNGLNGGTNPLFVVASSTSGFATSTVFEIGPNGHLYAPMLASLNCIGTDSTGKFQAGTCTGASYPFALTGNATSTLTQFNGGLTALASSTIGDGTTAGGLTISGGATTTDTTNGWTGRTTPTRIPGFSYATTTTWTGTTSAAYVVAAETVMPFGGTLRGMMCHASSTAAFLGVQPFINQTATTPAYFIASSTVGTIIFTASNTFNKGDVITGWVGTSTATTNNIGISCDYLITQTN